MSTNEKLVHPQTDESELTAASALACLAQNDRSEREEDIDQEEQVDDFTIPQRFTKSGRKRAVPFTIKLLKVLSDKRNAHIITWMPSGKSFNILKPKAFVADILPNEFKTAKYSSFTRKLHRWGFSRHYRGEEAGAFYHKDFQRGNLELVEQMTCHKSEPLKSPPPVQKAASEKKDAARCVAKKQAASLVTAPVVAAAAAKPSPAIRPPVITKALESKAALPPPPSLQQQQQPQYQLPVHQPAQPSVSIDAERLNAERLNAAIEAEVNRRLKERINAVALSRQAFAVSALRQQQLLGSSTSSQLAALMLKKQSEQLSAGGNVPTLNFSTMGYRALSTDGKPSAPPTNIQGARTA